jgi:hypothetical protein
MKLYGAIDLHSNNNVTVLIDEQDQEKVIKTPDPFSELQLNPLSESDRFQIRSERNSSMARFTSAGRSANGK